MAGGDVHIRAHSSSDPSAVKSVMDANTKSSGNMDTAVQVGSQTVYMTRCGANRYNALKEDSHGSLRFSVADDTKSERYGFLMLFSRQVTNIPTGHTESHVGDPNAGG